MAALTRLQLTQGNVEKQDGKAVLMRPDEDGGLAVFLEDVDNQWGDGQVTPDEVVEVLSTAHENSEARRGINTGIHHVRATAASMGLPDPLVRGARGFTPTAMPPV